MNDYLTDLGDHIRHPFGGFGLWDGRLVAALQPWVASPMAPAMRGVICWTSLGRTPQVLENQIIPQLQETKGCPKNSHKTSWPLLFLGFFLPIFKGRPANFREGIYTSNHPNVYITTFFSSQCFSYYNTQNTIFHLTLCPVTTRSFISP